MVVWLLLVVVFGLAVSNASGQRCGPLRPLTAFHDSAESNTGTVNASGSYSGRYEPYHAFSSDSIFWISAVYEDPAWISYTFHEPALVRGYRFLFCNGSLKTRAPKRFELQMMQDDDLSTHGNTLPRSLQDTPWTTVDSRCCETEWEGCEERSYCLGTPVTGWHFRFLFHEDNDERAPVVVVSLRNIQLL